ncbi:hypothetical protein ACHAXS_004478 [Conticribra weissflogii]
MKVLQLLVVKIMGTYLLASNVSSSAAATASFSSWTRFVRTRSVTRAILPPSSATTLFVPSRAAKKRNGDWDMQRRLGSSGGHCCSSGSSWVCKVRPGLGSGAIHSMTNDYVRERSSHFKRLQSFSSSSSTDGGSDNSDWQTQQQPSQSQQQSQSQQSSQQQSYESSIFPNKENIPLLDPTSPLSPLLTPQILSSYALPPTIIGKDDYQPNLPKNQRIVAFGDVHGDLSALRRFLIAARVLDPNSPSSHPRWIGNTTICIQTGDVLDRGDDELACFRLLASLSRQAVDAGGRILLLYGNHESLNSAGLFHYADPGGNAEFERDVGARIDYNYGSNRWRLQFGGNQPARWAAMEPGGFWRRVCWGTCW